MRELTNQDPTNVYKIVSKFVQEIISYFCQITLEFSSQNCSQLCLGNCSQLSEIVCNFVILFATLLTKTVCNLVGKCI